METVDTQGLEAIYRSCRVELLRFLIARTGDAAEAEDLMQELWIKLQCPTAGPVTHGRAYLFRMAQNLMVDRLRERQRRGRREHDWQAQRNGADPSLEPRDEACNAEEAMLAREEAALIASTIANLPPAARRAFEMHKLHGLSHADVAAELNISRSGVEKHMSLAMKHLRRALLD